jgi:ABC-type phosphate transport system auxiliary subunit
MLELVEKGEFNLNVISDRIESAQYLDEFMTIMNNVSSSISEVRDDVEQTVEAAEASLSGLHDAISKISTRLLQDLRQEIEPVLVSELSTVFAPGKINTANSMANEATIRGATEREEDGKGERKEEAESMLA